MSILIDKLTFPYLKEEPFSGLLLTYEYTVNEILQSILSFLYEHLFKDILYEIIDKEEPFSGNEL
jgi:hypothetical protein